MKELEQVKISPTYRSISLIQKRDVRLQCVFNDASTNAVAYLKTTDASGNMDVGFIFGKGKLAPRSEIPVPRL